MPELACPTCGQRADAADANAFPPQGALMGRPVVTCAACGSLLRVGRGVRRAHAAPVDPETWAQVRDVVAPASAVPVAPSLDVLQTIYHDLAGALNLVSEIPGYRANAELAALHDELVPSLLLARALVREAEAEAEAARKRAETSSARPD